MEGMRTGSVELHKLDGFQPEFMERVVDSARIEHIPLGRGTFRGRVLRARSGAEVLDSGLYAQGILGRGITPGDRVTLGMMLPSQTGSRMNGCQVDQPAAVLYTEEAEVSCRLESRTRWCSFQVTRDRLEALGLVVPGHFAGVAACSSSQVIRLSQRVQIELSEIATSIASSAAVLRDVSGPLDESFDRLLTAFIGALSPGPSAAAAPRARCRERIVSAAQDYMDANLGATVQIAQLCEVLSVSYKTLERAFLEALGVTPQSYLAARRLTVARRQLLDSVSHRPRVTEIALSCGCQHLGRFSTEYRKFFGETPSQTLAASRC